MTSYIAKPPHASPLNWSSPAAPRLLAAYPLADRAGTTARDAAGKRTATLVSSPTWGATPYGPGVTLDGSTQYLTAAGVTPPGAAGGSCAVLIRPASVANDPYLLTQDGTAGNSNDAAFRLEMFSAQLYMTTGNGSSYSQFSGAVTLSAGVWYFIFARWSPALFEAWVNGTRVVNGGSGATFGVASTAALQIGACESKGDASTRRLNGAVAAAYCWSRPLSDIDRLSLLADPFCMFRRRSVPVPLFDAGGGAPAGTILHVMNQMYAGA